jgi:hypothetical protein
MTAMRFGLLPLVLCCAGRALVAQDTAIVIHPESSAVRLERRELPRQVAEEAIAFYNAATTARLAGPTWVPAGTTWRGDVAIRNGPVVLAGRLEGSLLVINGDAILADSAAITGDLFVVGGTATVPGTALVSGTRREYPEQLGYRLTVEGIEYAPNLRGRLRNLGVQHTWATADSRSSLTIASGGTFNRVEGLPIVFGPLFDWRVRPRARFRLDALGVLRSAGNLSDSRSDLGYMVRTELRSGETRGVGIGFRAYDVVSPVEDWGLHAGEVGWEAFLFHRDYRDYFLNKGVSAHLFVQPERRLTLALELRRDWHSTVGDRDPWTVFRNERPWRPNPPIDDGHYVTVAGSATLDTRNDARDPTSGWYVRGTLESSGSRDVTPQPGVPAAVRDPIPTDGSYRYTRLFLDARRYARVSPSGRLNLRLVAGGWLAGDPLPLQRRLSIGGPEPMAGHGFRYVGCNLAFTAAAFAGSGVAACDRVLALQVEYRGHLSLNWSYNPSRAGDPARASITQLFIEGLDLVVFANAGQAWLVGAAPGRVPSGEVPPLDSWVADLGMGIDWGGFGVYVAKAVTVGQRVRVSVRLDHRF